MKITAIVLAAGKGTRLNSQKVNKVLRLLNGKPMLAYTVEHLKNADINDIIFVVGYKENQIRDYFGDHVRYTIQNPQVGTGDAAITGLKIVDQDTDLVLILQGDDSAFYTPLMLKDLIKSHQDSNSDLTFLSCITKNPQGLGRIIRDNKGQVMAIREEINATEEEKLIHEVNTACYLGKYSFLKTFLPQISLDPHKKEYLLPDVIDLGLKSGKKISAYTLKDANLVVGVNTKKELNRARRLIKKRL